MSANKDKQCQAMLTFLIQKEVCSREQAKYLWQQWQISKSKHPADYHPYQFLQQQGISLQVFQQQATLAQTPSPEQRSPQETQEIKPFVTTPAPEKGLVEMNNRLAQEIVNQALMSTAQIDGILQECNEREQHLGQTLIRNQCLPMFKLVKLMQSLGGNTTQAQIMETGDRKEIAATGIASFDGDNFAGHQILDEIARGGMGVVYRARQTGMKRIVALKVLLAGTMADSGQIRRFLREAKATACLSHPNIIPIYSMGEEQGYHYFTMKYVEGKTLQDLIDCQETPLTEKLVVLRKICNALQHAHEHKILHRDVKPSNILIDNNGEPYVTDFGLAKFIDSKSVLTQTGTAVGTPFYMSPEQAKGDKRYIDHRSDIYGLGIILYQMITGHLPFVSETLAELYKKIAREEPLLPRKINPQISIDLQAVCLKTIDKTPAFRYATAQEMADDLSRFLENKQVRARQFSPRIALTRAYRRYRRQFNAAAVLFVCWILLAVCAYGWQQFEKAQQDQRNQQKLKLRQDFGKAQKLYDRGDYQEALTILQQIVNFAEDDYNAYLELGKLYQKLENFSAARKAFLKAQKLAPNDPKVLFHCSQFFYAVQEYSKALLLLDRYLLKNSTAKGYRLRAAVLRSLNEQQRAIADTERANELEAQKLQNLLKEIVAGQSQFKMTRLQALLQKYPTYEKGYMARARLHFENQNIHKALRDISRVIELNPQSKYYFLKGKWLYKIGYGEQAQQQLLLAMDKLPAAKPAYEIRQLLAQIDLELQEYKRAYRNYRQILSAENEGAIHLQLAKAAFGMKNYRLAWKHLQKTSSLSAKQQGEADYYLGKIYYRQKRRLQAVKYWKKALAAQIPQSSQINFLLGKTYAAAGKFTTAAKYLQRASKDLTEKVLLFRLLGKCYMETKKPQSAIQAFSHCISLQPWQASYYYQRGLAFTSLQKYEAAEKDLFTAQRLEPNNLSPVIQVVKNLFDAKSAANFFKLRIMVSNFNYAVVSGTACNMFANDIETLRLQCFAAARQLEQQQHQQRPWNKQQAQSFLHALIYGDSPAIYQMAYSSLAAMYSHVELHALLREMLQQKQYLASVTTRLEKLYSEITDKYLQEAKIEQRQLLLRFYDARDRQGLKELYYQGENGIRCLAALLESSEENPIIRFLAARALLDLRTCAGYFKLQRSAKAASNEIARLFSNAALALNNFAMEDPQVFFGATKLSSVYARTIAAQFAPLANTQVLQELIKDREIRVRLTAAQRLRRVDYRTAESELLAGFSHADPLVRLYSLYMYWQFPDKKDREYRQMRIRCSQNLPLLIKATKDRDVRIRRFAVATIGDIFGAKHKKVLKRHLQDKDDLTRFHAIIALAKTLQLEEMVNLMCNPEERLLFRIAVFMGAQKVWGNSPKTSLGTMMRVFGKLTKDPDPKLRLLIYMSLGRSVEGTGAQILSSNHMHPDQAVRLGSIIGIIDSGKRDLLPNVKHYLDDKDLTVRSFAASAIIYLTRRYYLPERELWHQKFKKAEKKIRQGAAVGYLKMLDSTVPYPKRQALKDMWDWDKMYERFIKNMFNTFEKLPKVRTHFVAERTLDSQQEALECYTRVIDLYPQLARYWFERGIIHYVMGNYSQSIKDMETALKKRSDIPIFKLWLARAYYLGGQYPKAQKTAAEVARVFPWNVDLCHLQVKIAAALGLKKQAQQFSRRLKLLRR